MLKIHIKNIALILTLFLTQFSRAQIGGESTYQFLSIPSTARSASLANSGIAVTDNDINLCLYNPSLLDSNVNQSFALNYANYISDINFGTVSYARHITGIGTFSAGLQYFDYGKFLEANNAGFKLGEFTGSDYSLYLSYAKPIYSQIQAGISLKILYSDYYINTSLGLAMDGGISFKSKDKLSNLSLVFHNLGHQIKPYRKGNYENLPFDLLLGFAQKFSHAPFRVMFTLHHLHNWSLAYDSPLEEEKKILGTENKTTRKRSTLSKFGDNFEKFGNEFIRHLNVGIEIIPIKNFEIRIGYNFQRYKELAIKDKFGMTGFSLGAGIRIYKFHISYSRAVYHIAGITHTFSITSNLREFIRR